jgi:predicted Rossmann-fold nucleotide-binding protein
MVDEYVVCVCGGRNYNDARRVVDVLDRINAERPIGLLVTGAAPGADTLAERWAQSRGVDYIGCPAKWGKHHRAAGPIRNTHMLDRWSPQLVVAFPGGNGTADCVGKARSKGIPIQEAV